jgi:hypothetical protein
MGEIGKGEGMMEIWNEIYHIIETAVDIIDGYSSWNYSWRLPKDIDEKGYELLSIAKQHRHELQQKINTYDNLIPHLERACHHFRVMNWDEVEDKEICRRCEHNKDGSCDESCPL